jgi:predicted membrane-bound spermidine synthase
MTTLAAAAPAAAQRAMPLRLSLAAVGALFFLSGAAALVYQVAWQRILALHSGVGIYSIAMIVAAFMAGLGAGSHLGGVLSARVEPSPALRIFGMLELGIALFGALSCWLYYDWLYLEVAWLYAPAWRAGMLHFAGFLLPTGLMGMSLPFLVRATVSDVGRAGGTIGFLYGINTLGAAAGALVTPWLLIRLLGIRGAVLSAAGGNLLAGLGALLVARLASMERAAPVQSEGHEVAGTLERAASRPFGLWMALYALSGFCALSLEIVWFRIVDVAVKSMAYTFGTVLALFLFGLAAGSLAGAPLVARLRQPLRAFLALQCLLLACSGLAVVLIAWLPPQTPLYRWYFEYWRWYDGFKLGQTWDLSPLLLLYLVLPGFLYFVPTFLMGLSFPVLQHAVHDELRTTGRKVGFLQAANIAGCVAGSLVAGLVLLNGPGTSGTLRLLMAVGLGFAALGARHYGARGAFGLLGSVLAALVWLMPGQEQLWLRLHGRTSGLIDEDASGVAAVTLHPSSPEWHLSANGKGQSAIPFFEGHTLMGSVPVIVHPEPLDVAIIGLGTGGTAWSAACRPETRSVTVWELSSPQPRLLRRFLERDAYPPLEGLLRDPRVEVHAADGRNALEKSERLFDIIQADAIFPDRAYSGNLYSVEFYERCARKLKPGGVMVGWAPTPRIYATFHRVFPHVVGVPNHSLFLGSNQPIAIDVDAWLARLDSPEVSGYLGPRIVEEVRRRLIKFQPLVRGSRRAWSLNHDLFPRDEFLSP